MNKTKVLLTFCCILILVSGLNSQTDKEDDLQELLNQIRREKFDTKAD